MPMDWANFAIFILKCCCEQILQEELKPGLMRSTFIIKTSLRQRALNFALVMFNQAVVPRLITASRQPKYEGNLEKLYREQDCPGNTLGLTLVENRWIFFNTRA